MNNGHECLVVRAFEPLLDAVSPDQFSPGADRHVGQRNIAVVQAASPASIDLVLDLGWQPKPATPRSRWSSRRHDDGVAADPRHTVETPAFRPPPRRSPPGCCRLLRPASADVHSGLSRVRRRRC